MNRVAYKLSAQDNGTFMFPNQDFRKCPSCGYRTDFTEINPEYVLRSRARDLSATFDGHWIASVRLRDFCAMYGYTTLQFCKFPNDPYHFGFLPTMIVRFDALRRQTRFENLCPTCGNYESVIGTKPCFLLVSQPINDGFFRSDLFFASGNEKHPILIIGLEMREKLKKAKLKGLEFSDAFGID